MHDARHAQTIPELGCGIVTTSGSGTESTSEQLTGDARAGANTLLTVYATRIGEAVTVHKGTGAYR